MVPNLVSDFQNSNPMTFDPVLAEETVENMQNRSFVQFSIVFGQKGSQMLSDLQSETIGLLPLFGCSGGEQSR